MEENKITNKEKDLILADIEITRANLYVFKNSQEKEVWEKMLDNAMVSLNQQPEYSKKLILRVNVVIDNLWKFAEEPRFYRSILVRIPVLFLSLKCGIIFI